MPEKFNFPTPNRFIKLLYSIGFGPLIGKMILLLKTKGRKTGLPRVTPLQYEEIKGAYYVGSMRGTKADWFRNVIANPNVEVCVGSKRFEATAELITDTSRIADFLELRIRRHPKVMGKILQLEGLPAKPKRYQLESYAKNLSIVIIRPKG